MRIDLLILERDCPHCGVIRHTFDMNAMTDDNFSGKNGQALHVFTTMSNNASIDLLGRLGLSGKYVPLMILHDGRILEKSKDICQYAIEQGMAK